MKGIWHSCGMLFDMRHVIEFGEMIALQQLLRCLAVKVHNPQWRLQAVAIHERDSTKFGAGAKSNHDGKIRRPETVTCS